MSSNLVTIVKDGKLINIPDDDLRPADLVVFQAGDIVPADLKLIEAWELEIDEFDVTGEIMPVVKKLADEDVFLYMGSRVTKGAGKGLVIATGDQTEYGQVLQQSWEKNKPYEFRFFKKEYLIPVLLLLPAFAVLIHQSDQDYLVSAIYGLLAVLLIFLQNYELVDYWIISGELKTCEHLQIQIRDPGALERMSDIDTICYDKTGVLTTRHIDVQRIYFANAIHPADQLLGDGETARQTRLACALCHDVIYYEKIDTANPIDKAIISLASKNGIDVPEALSQHQRIYDQPFDSENRFMACGYDINGKAIYFVKGDPAVVLKMCDDYLTAAGEKKKADFNFWMLINDHIDAITQNGGMVIALATTAEYFGQGQGKYTFLCLLQLENTLQPGARETIRASSLEGIRSILLTGDRAETAARVGVACGITTNPNIFLTGKVIERMGLGEVGRQSDYCSIFARLLPSQKGVLIRLLQQRNHLVAMVGDGPNDGIALKSADISISFVQNSSPIARRLSKILINNLTDLLILRESSGRIKQRAEELHTLRGVLFVMVFLSLYLWALTFIKLP